MKFLPVVLALPLVSALSGLFSAGVLAHPGPHDDVDNLGAAASHIVASPDHASWLILALTAVLSILAVKAAIRIATPSKSDEKR